jgi:hypothetical protein
MSASLQPLLGRLGQLIVESPDTSVAPRLEFFIEIEFAETELDGEVVKPFFRASNIVVSANSWQSLAGSNHTFPWMPKPGSIDAGVLAFGIRNPADLIALDFGVIKEGQIEVSFETEVDFEIEADREELGQVTVVITNFPLAIEPLKLATSLVRRCEGDPDQISEAVLKVVDANAYESVTKVPGGFEMGIAEA